MRESQFISIIGTDDGITIVNTDHIVLARLIDTGVELRLSSGDNVVVAGIPGGQLLRRLAGNSTEIDGGPAKILIKAAEKVLAKVTE
jgi:hypothetical protein